VTWQPHWSSSQQSTKEAHEWHTRKSKSVFDLIRDMVKVKGDNGGQNCHMGQFLSPSIPCTPKTYAANKLNHTQAQSSSIIRSKLRTVHAGTIYSSDFRVYEQYLKAVKRSANQWAYKTAVTWACS